jgi:serine/threonine protein phosphatase PrpC
MPLLEGDRFCEQCGARLVAEKPSGAGCRVCGADPDAIDADGYCAVCGARERPAADRVELDLAVAAAVSDRGRVHHRNEDAFAVKVIGARAVAVVVCDGISSASAGDAAAQGAAEAAVAVLAAALADPTAECQAAIVRAVASAQAAVTQVPWTTRVGRAVPSCTLVCAVWRAGEIVVGSVGDSRAYWSNADETTQLTIDDSWAEAEVAGGRLSIEEAMRDPRSHSITHWIGADAPDRPPSVVTLHPAGRGRLLLCSDGLWNYLSDAAALRELIASLPDGASPAALARSLTEAALARGGRDNITVAVVDVDPT